MLTAFASAAGCGGIESVLGSISASVTALASDTGLVLASLPAVPPLFVSEPPHAALSATPHAIVRKMLVRVMREDLLRQPAPAAARILSPYIVKCLEGLA